MKHFKLDKKFISIWSLHNYTRRMSFTHKKITYKVNTANTERIINQRYEKGISTS